MVSLYRKSFANITFLGLGNVINAAFGFVFLTATAKFLNIEDFGKYALLISLLVSFSKLLDFGTNAVFVTKSITQDDKDLVNEFAGMKFILFTATVPISFLILYLLGFYNFNYFLLFFLGLTFYSFNYFLFSIFQRYQNFFALIFINTIPALIKLVFAVCVFTKIISLNIYGFFAVFSLSLAPCLIFYFAIPKNFKNIRFSFSNIFYTFKQILSPGISQAINEGFPAINNSMAKIFTGFTNTGFFSLAEKISSIFSIVSFTIFTVLLPGNAYRKKGNKKYDYLETIMLSMGVFFIAVLLIILAQILIPWFFAHKFDNTLLVLDLLIFAASFTAIHIFLENYFFVENQTKLLAYISTGKLLVLLVISLILAPIYSITGIAWAQLISSLLALITVIILIFRNRNLLKDFDP